MFQDGCPWIRTFAYGGLEGIYQGMNGDMVVADVRGPGTYDCVAEAVIEVLRDRHSTTEMAGQFEDWLVVSRRSAGKILVSCQGLEPLRRRGQLLLRLYAPVSGRKVEGATVVNAGESVLLTSHSEDGSTLTAPIFCHLGACFFKCAVPPHSEGLRVKKKYDRFHGRQRAWVKVDGTPVGEWYEPIQNRSIRWAESQFEVPKAHLDGKTEVVIEIDPPSGTPLWNWSILEVFNLD